jgi:ABC-2 type transport system ATP-binding protein
VSDIEAIADRVLIMKKGNFVQQGTVAELIEKAQGKVWELAVSPEEARKWQTKANVANLRHEGNGIVLRIVSETKPAEQAVISEASLEDLYLYYFPPKEGDC